MDKEELLKILEQVKTVELSPKVVVIYEKGEKNFHFKKWIKFW